MEKILDATFDGEVFMPDEPIDLEPNTKVKLKLIVKKSKKSGKPYSALEYMASLNLDDPPDFAANIDEYLYGGKSLDDAR